MNKLYDVVKDLLTANKELRDNDKKLMWAVWRIEGVILNDTITLVGFLKATSPESIRRTRQKIQEKFPTLDASPQVKVERQKIEEEKGTFVYREKVPVFNDKDNTVKFVYKE